MSLRTKIGAGLLALSPMVTLAAETFDGEYFEGIAESFKAIVGLLLPAFIGLAIIGFAYGLFVYLKSGAEDKEKGKSIMIWGGLAVVILLSIYGIAGLFQSITGADGNIENAPTLLDNLTD